MTSMLTKAARALENAAEECGFSIFDDDARYLTLAVLNAIREPSPEMLVAGADKLPLGYHGSAEGYAVAVNDAGDAWQAMIDHITTEGKG